MATAGMEDFDEETPVAELPEEETPLTEEGTPEKPSTVSIPMASLGGKEMNEGDTITLRVVSVGEDGVEAEVTSGKEADAAGDQYEEADTAIDGMAGAPGGY